MNGAFARQHRHDRIVAELVVVDQILVAERDADDPLHHQRLDVVLDQVLITPVNKAASETPGQADRSVSGAQQQRAGI